jgi:hypothetical protein
MQDGVGEGVGGVGPLGAAVGSVLGQLVCHLVEGNVNMAGGQDDEEVARGRAASRVSRTSWWFFLTLAL